MAKFDADFEVWVQKARDYKIEDVASIVGVPGLKKQGAELIGPCPRCGGKDRFSINTKDQVFNCRGSEGGDGIKLACHVLGLNFVEACELITGKSPPREDKAAPPRPIDDRAERERAEDRDNDSRSKADADAKAKEKKSRSAAALIASGISIFGTLAEAYYRARCIDIQESEAIDLRFIPALEYRGYADPDADQETVLGSFPCIVAAMRDKNREIVGAHRTYLDPKQPVKLKAPGDHSRNLAKKMFGQKGLIFLGEPGPIMAVGEGIETSLAWGRLGRIESDFCLATAGDLGNLAGGWTDTIPHPKFQRRSIPNAIFDPARPGMPIPEIVSELILLGDGDSDPPNTHAHLLTAVRRHMAAGRTVSVDMAPAGKDWNDVLIEFRKQP